MPIEVIYPEKQHQCFPEDIPGGYLFVCQECTYRRTMTITTGEVKILDKGDRTVAHYGDAGVCGILGTSKQIRTALNDASAKCQLNNDGAEIPTSFG